jgi:hypothetical protein
MVNCCFDAPFIQRTLSVGIHIDACGRKLTLSIEKLTYVLELSEMTYGKEHSFALAGIVKLRYTSLYITACLTIFLISIILTKMHNASNSIVISFIVLNVFE